MTIKNDWVSRSAYDSLEKDTRSLRKQVFDMALGERKVSPRLPSIVTGHIGWGLQQLPKP
jgi:hypothetical protein